MSKKINAIVCGTTFGKYYLKALKRANKDFNVVGILGKGSKRSKRVALSYKVPLYSSVEELPEGIELACVIVRSEGVGGEGTDLCVNLLNRNINIIQEQPVHQRHLEKCYKLAKERNLLYMTANLYSYLPNIKSFIAYARKLNLLSKLEYINISFSTQVSYTALDLLILAGVSGSLKINNDIIKHLGPFDIIYGEIGRVPILIEFNNKINPEFPDYNMHLMHNYHFYYNDGVLSLEDTFGSVIWRPRTYIKPTKNNLGIFNEPIYSILDGLRTININDFFSSYWIDAIKGELIEAKTYIENKELNYCRVNRELSASRNWRKLHDIAGYSEFTNENKEKFLLLKEIENFKSNLRRDCRDD